MLKISLDALQVLDAIDRRGSFAAAAEELHRSASTLSYTISQLEQDLGIEVFDRSGHRAKLTRAGRALLDEGRHLLEGAYALQRRVRNLSMGWEAELVIACDELVGASALFPLLQEFYSEGHPTQIRITSEVLSGGWDALLAGRAGLAITQEGMGPAVGVSVRAIGKVQMAFVCSPGHPLAQAREPLRQEQLRKYRRIATADTSRALPARSAGILDALDSLTVSTMQAKIEAHAAGLGVGFVPRARASPLLAKGLLVEKRLAEPGQTPNLCVAWRSRDAGVALKWFVSRLESQDLRRTLTG